MRYWVGVTDNDWFAFLSREGCDEVNFWQPGGRRPFTQLDVGAPFLFKLKSPNNHISGCAAFVSFTQLPLSIAWDVFARKNGAASRAEFERMIRTKVTDRSAKDPVIGCTVLSSPRFWAFNDWIEAGPYWKGTVVVGCYFDEKESDSRHLWAEVERRDQQAFVVAVSEAMRFGTPTLVKARLGQSGFRVVVTDAYQRRCAITGERTLPTLEAAHILPYSENGPHNLRNGLLLRSDFHRLFDAGLVTVTPNFVVEVSPRIREEWFNGKAYYRLHGERLTSLPGDPSERPSAKYLQWHNENRFAA